MDVINQDKGDLWQIYNGDSCEILKGIPDNKIGYSIFSPPFSQLYTYSNSERDLGNCRTDEEFYEHFKFIVKELYRTLQPGRLVSIHCMLIPAMKERDGYIGLKDFRGDLIRLFQACGFIFHGEVTIWKDPLIEAVRTKAIGLMHKQLCKDSSRCRQGLPDYVITMRKPGENQNLISHENGMITYAGDDEVKKGVYSHEVWRKYASPVWFDIRQTNTLNKSGAREEKDERHICPLQLDVIERCLILWSKPDDIVLSPFMGIGSEGYQAVKMKRRFIGIELKQSYYQCSIKNLQKAEKTEQQLSLFGE